MAHEKERSVKLPESMTSRSDLSRSIAELESLDNFLRDSAIRQPGSSMQLPKTSSLFEQLVSASNLNMLAEDDRRYLLESLNWLRDHAPVMHISFGADPSPIFMQKLIAWLRQHISPFLFLQVGLHPTIGAGCVIRTTNKYFDFSLKQRFAAKRELLMQELLAGTPKPPTPPAPEAVKTEAKA